MKRERKINVSENTEERKSLIRSYLPLVLATAAALLLSLEYWLQQAGYQGLCPTAGCAVVGTYVKYGEIAFIGMGAAFFWVLAGLLFLSRRLDKGWLWMLVAVVLTAGLAFDGGILGFQHFGIKETCILCYAVGLALFLILFAYGWMRRSLAAVVMGVAVWSAAFASQAMFVFPEKTPDLRETVLTSWRASEQPGPQLYYFFSLHCPFCTHVLSSLAAHPPQGGEWHLVPLDTQPADQRKLAAFLDHPLVATNPFQAILDVEREPASDMEIQPQAVAAANNGGAFLRNSGYRGVPLLIVQETPTRRVTLQGRDPILNYLLEKRLIPFRLFF
ncbi:hypothetical protein SAMN05660653_02848 [Desulfonatronum thiosulfatophilum]|uniref:Vitamin K epoxide reductase family protein n=1 Tax=Desulfonatronum thiosulfatophilum TaxID=617002 RepID=A0A1G6EIU5_9BACT|nr:hypothetical protein [Desulfonatronum thiosulfatophilum]SDB56875.1 hypothetical protein SAMN05660653_02848 [Desulfonatronum thiosulfatophilum]